MTRIVFMGTPDFAVPALAKLALMPEYNLVGVYTQPDKPAGRGHKLLAPPVKTFAVEHNLPIFQPCTLHAPETQAELAALQPEIIIVAAYGLILPRPVLELPPRGCVNVHASLLPKYRGAAPILAAILNGENATGITLMQMDRGIDTGPILAQAELPIRPTDTTGTLSAQLALLGANLLAQTLPGWLAGEIQPRAQDETQASFAPPLSKEQGRLDWTQPASALDCRVRAFDPWPGTFTLWQNKRLKINQVRISNLQPPTSNLQPGQVIQWDGGVGVVTGQGMLELLEVQLEGKRAVRAVDFARGQPGFIGAQLG